jgi:hypothetical protein
LKKYFPGSSAIYKAALDRYLRKEVGRDDILDALAVAVTASQLDGKYEANLPQYPEKDTPNATHLACVEAKIFSRLSSGVKNARYFNQAARYVACMAELIHRANLKPGEMKQLAFFIFAPGEQIDAGIFSTQSSPDNIDEMVKRRVSEYNGEKDSWYHKGRQQGHI